MVRFDDVQVGDVLTGVVDSVVPFGTFVRIADDAHGLVPELTGLAVGTPVAVRVLDVDRDRRRASLALRQA